MVEILLVPSVRRGNGSGHLVRCFDLARSLGTLAAVYLPDSVDHDSWSADELHLAYPLETGAVRIIGALGSGARFKLIVLDNRQTSLDTLDHWSRKGSVVAIDEGGDARISAAYLVDILPRHKSSKWYNSAPNIASLGFLSLPHARREPPTLIRRVLVSFGGEDPAQLAEAFLHVALGTMMLDSSQVTVVTGALSNSSIKYPGITAIGPVQDLKEKLRSYDLVVTQFGLTAFEAAWAGCAVLLLNPGMVHEQLSKAAGFMSLGIIRPDARLLRWVLREPSMLVQKTQATLPEHREDLASRLAQLAPRHTGPCPGCARHDGRVLYRDQKKTYTACPDCGLVRMAYFVAKANPYTEHSYFFEEYKAQYGRTYIEDIPKIRASAATRLRVVESLLPGTHTGQLILDVGCAYGAFVAEAQERGWNAIGSDLSADAVGYVKEHFKIPAFVADFAEAGADGLYPRELTCLTMWFVIEHFDELSRVLWRVASLLKPGAVFAFSTPSGSGISARKSPADFYSQSPDDHFTVWDPKTAPGILKRFGFDVQRIVVTGHHPERFWGVPNDPGSLRYKVTMAFSRLLGLGDTFECYATYSGTTTKNPTTTTAEYR